MRIFIAAVAFAAMIGAWFWWRLVSQPVEAAPAARAGNGAVLAAPHMGPLEQAKAKDYLEWLVALYDRGLCEPLPLPLKTSVEYAGALAKMDGSGEAELRARRAWNMSVTALSTSGWATG